MKKQILLRVLIVLVLLGSLSYIVYKDYKQVNNANAPFVNSSATSTVAANTASKPALVATSTNPYKVPEKPALIAPTPDLNRSYNPPENFSDSKKNELKKRYSDEVLSLKKDPEQINTWFDLAILRKTAGDYEGARDIWIFTSKVWPQIPVSFIGLGDVYTFNLKDLPKAEENLKIAVLISPQDASMYARLSEFYRFRYPEKKSEALPTLLSGLKLNPKSTDFMVVIAYYYQDTGDKVNARTYFEMALAIAKDNKNTALINYLNQDLKDL